MFIRHTLSKSDSAIIYEYIHWFLRRQSHPTTMVDQTSSTSFIGSLIDRCIHIVNHESRIDPLIGLYCYGSSDPTENRFGGVYHSGCTYFETARYVVGSLQLLFIIKLTKILLILFSVVATALAVPQKPGVAVNPLIAAFLTQAVIPSLMISP